MSNLTPEEATLRSQLRRGCTRWLRLLSAFFSQPDIQYAVTKVAKIGAGTILALFLLSQIAWPAWILGPALLALPCVLLVLHRRSDRQWRARQKRLNRR